MLEHTSQDYTGQQRSLAAVDGSEALNDPRSGRQLPGGPMRDPVRAHWTELTTRRVQSGETHHRQHDILLLLDGVSFMRIHTSGQKTTLRDDLSSSATSSATSTTLGERY